MNSLSSESDSGWDIISTRALPKTVTCEGKSNASTFSFSPFVVDSWDTGIEGITAGERSTKKRSAESGLPCSSESSCLSLHLPLDSDISLIRFRFAEWSDFVLSSFEWLRVEGSSGVVADEDFEFGDFLFLLDFLSSREELGLLLISITSGTGDSVVRSITSWTDISAEK